MPLQPAKCHECHKAKARSDNPDARCTRHQTAVHQEIVDAPEPRVRNPVPIFLAGYNSARPVPTFNEEGERVIDGVVRRRRDHPFRSWCTCAACVYHFTGRKSA